MAFPASEGENETLEPHAEGRIDELWRSGSPISLVELYPAVAREARTLIPESLSAQRPRLKPADAIHLATPTRMGVKYFHTYDEKLHKHSSAFSFPIREPFTVQGQLSGT